MTPLLSSRLESPFLSGEKNAGFLLQGSGVPLRCKKAKSMNGCSNIHFPVSVEWIHWIHFCSTELVSQHPSQLDKAGCYFPANMVPVKILNVCFRCCSSRYCQHFWLDFGFFSWRRKTCRLPSTPRNTQASTILIYTAHQNRQRRQRRARADAWRHPRRTLAWLCLEFEWQML